MTEARTAVIIPALNEADHIDAILAFFRREAPEEVAVIAVADGGSTDDTRAIVARHSAEDPRVRVVDNPDRLQSAGMNRAVAALPPSIAFIVRADAHARYPAGFVATLLREQRASGAESVVNRLNSVGHGCFQRAVAAVSNSPFGTGGAAHRSDGASGFIDHGHHALFTRASYQSIGGYDESFVTNEDGEYDTRLRAAGGRVWFTNAAAVDYHPRRTPAALLNQYYRYGRGRAGTRAKHREKLRLRQIIPPLILVALVLSLLVAPVSPWTLIVPAGYLLGVLAATLLLTVRHRDPCVLGALAALPIMHLAWGTGFIAASVSGRRPAPIITTGVKRIGYFAYDLNDEAVARRVTMMRAGGVEIKLIGFQRHAEPVEALSGVPATVMGRTKAGNFLGRMVAVGGALLHVPRWRARIGSVDAIVARNLETLAVAAVVRGRSSAPLVYELLDIHRLTAEPGWKGRILRLIEGYLLRRTALILTSSPAFVSGYLDRHYPRLPRTMLIENKLLVLDGLPAALLGAGERRNAPPWRIGWFGRLRCRRSLAFLADLAETMAGTVEIDMRGSIETPLEDVIEAALLRSPYLRYHGRYRYEDLPAHYRAVHFTWAIDFFEAGLNSEWLLPNRLYEGCAFGTVPIAMAAVETGRWLAARDIGVRLDTLEEAEPTMRAMTPEHYAALADVVERHHDSFIADQCDCDALVEAIVTAGKLLLPQQPR